MHTVNPESELQGMPRRTVVKGAAWAAPVVAVAAAAPLAAASDPEPPAATYSGGYVASVAHTAWGTVRINGVAVIDDEELDAALPANAYYTLTPPPGVTLEIRSINQAGVASITGPDANGAYTVYPTPGITESSVQVRLSGPGNLAVQVFGDAPGGPYTGVRA